MLTGAQLAVLAGELKDGRYAALLAAQDYEAIVALLNVQPEIPNPEEQTQKPKRMSVEDFVSALKAAEVVTVYQNGALVQAYSDSLTGGNRAYTKKLRRGLKTLVSAETVTAIEALQDVTEPDPNWTATVLGESRVAELGLPRVEPRDVQAVANV